MIDRTMLYQILYALVARDGREATLFGAQAPLALGAFTRSLACDAFPELWFELPLAGKPWFDLHALTSHEDLRPNDRFEADRTGGHPEAFAWFAAQDDVVRQLALSWDTSRGEASLPAVQLLVRENRPEITCSFLEAVGRSDATGAYQHFVERLPEGWFPCYAGVFPPRPGHHLRVECIPHPELQHAYATNAGLLARHLAQTGLELHSGTIVERCQLLARTPFALEFQFDVDALGSAEATFGASLRFTSPADGPQRSFDPHGEAGGLMRHIESWGLADERWHLLADTSLAMHVTFAGDSVTLFCYPAFVKLRWTDGMPLDAKAYLMAGVL